MCWPGRRQALPECTVPGGGSRGGDHRDGRMRQADHYLPGQILRTDEIVGFPYIPNIDPSIDALVNPKPDGGKKL